MRAQSGGGEETSGSRAVDKGKRRGRVAHAVGVREDTRPRERAAAERDSIAPAAAAGRTASAISGAFPANFAAASLPTSLAAIMGAGVKGEVAAPRPGAKLRVGEPRRGTRPKADPEIVVWEMRPVVRGTPQRNDRHGFSFLSSTAVVLPPTQLETAPVAQSEPDCAWIGELGGAADALPAAVGCVLDVTPSLVEAADSL